jgi:dimethylargininase
MTELAKKCLLTPGGITRILDTLAADRLVERRVPPENRRVVLATITDDGLRAAAARTADASGRGPSAVLLQPGQRQRRGPRRGVAGASAAARTDVLTEGAAVPVTAGSVPAVLVRAVSPRLAEAELTFLQREPIDPDRAAAQHRDYVDLLRRLGHRIIPLPAAPEHPDGTFVEDAVVVVDDVAVLTRPGAQSRRGEVASMATAVRSLGLRTREVAEPATLDGGDVLQVGSRVFVGTGGRTSPDAVDQLRSLLLPLGRTVVPVPVTGCLHLKTGATALPDGTVIAVAGWLDTAAFTDEGLRVVDAPEASGADLLLSGGPVVLSAAAPGTAQLVRSLGFAAYPADIDELEKAECGSTCPFVCCPPSRSAP